MFGRAIPETSGPGRFDRADGTVSGSARTAGILLVGVLADIMNSSRMMIEETVNRVRKLEIERGDSRDSPSADDAPNSP